jgi:hypothetical protein
MTFSAPRSATAFIVPWETGDRIVFPIRAVSLGNALAGVSPCWFRKLWAGALERSNHHTPLSLASTSPRRGKRQIHAVLNKKSDRSNSAVNYLLCTAAQPRIRRCTVRNTVDIVSLITPTALVSARPPFEVPHPPFSLRPGSPSLRYLPNCR